MIAAPGKAWSLSGSCPAGQSERAKIRLEGLLITHGDNILSRSTKMLQKRIINQFKLLSCLDTSIQTIELISAVEIARGGRYKGREQAPQRPSRYFDLTRFGPIQVPPCSFVATLPAAHPNSSSTNHHALGHIHRHRPPITTGLNTLPATRSLPKTRSNGGGPPFPPSVAPSSESASLTRLLDQILPETHPEPRLAINPSTSISLESEYSLPSIPPVSSLKPTQTRSHGMFLLRLPQASKNCDELTCCYPVPGPVQAKAS